MLEVPQQPLGVCRHERTERQVIRSDFFNQSFSAEMDVCKDCGTQLWTAETQVRFEHWVEQLKQNHRDTFHVQFHLSESGRQTLQTFLRRFPGVSLSSLIRALVTVYLASLTRFPQFQSLMDEMIKGASYKKLLHTPKARTNLQLNPVGMMDLQTWADMLKLSPSKLIEEVVHKMIAVQTESDSRFSEFWGANLLPFVELILRAV